MGVLTLDRTLITACGHVRRDHGAVPIIDRHHAVLIIPGACINVNAVVVRDNESPLGRRDRLEHTTQ